MKLLEKHRKYLPVAVLTIILVAIIARAAVLWHGTAIHATGTIKPIPSARVTTIDIDFGELYPGNETSVEKTFDVTTNVNGTIDFYVNGTNLNVLEKWEIRIYKGDTLIGIIDDTDPTAHVQTMLSKGTTAFKARIYVKAGNVTETTSFTLELKAVIES